jgi:BirA family biotin operon repressor/biotin-[acetyl-CoA-carboxylase] ligase
VNLLRFTSTGSTNEVAAGHARAGSPEGLVVVADEQTAGRGRLGRRWVAPPGASLLCSVLLRPPLEPGELHLATALVALAARSACDAVVPGAVMLKWPNDLVVGEKKLAGVLAELVSAVPVALVVGVGLNLFFPVGWPPDEGRAALLLNATTLEEISGHLIERDVFLALFLDHLERAYDDLEEDGGVARLAAAYRAACSTIGEQVTVELPTRRVVGRAVDLDESGALIVETAAGHERLEVGDVVHLRPRLIGPL